MIKTQSQSDIPKPNCLLYTVWKKAVCILKPLRIITCWLYSNKFVFWCRFLIFFFIWVRLSFGKIVFSSPNKFDNDELRRYFLRYSCLKSSVRTPDIPDVSLHLTWRTKLSIFAYPLHRTCLNVVSHSLLHGGGDHLSVAYQHFVVISQHDLYQTISKNKTQAKRTSKIC